MNNLLIWSTDPMQKVFKDGFPPEKATCEVIMESARGALATGQIAVKSSKEETLEIKPFKLREKISGEEVTVIPHFVGFVMINVNTPDTPIRPISRCPLSGEIDREAPCKIPDPLLENECLRVDPKETQPIWFMAEIPLEQKPGIYKGEFKFKISNHLESVPVEMRVYNATVPKERHLWVINHLRAEPLAEFYGVEPWSSEHWEILENFAQDMALHRQSMINPPMFSLIKVIKDKIGLSFDFTLYDRFVELFEKAGVVGRIEGSGFASLRRGPRVMQGIEILNREGKVVHRQPPLDIYSPETRRFLGRFFPVLERHLEEKGWLSIYQQRISDEPRDKDAQHFRFLAAMVKEFAPKIRRMEPILTIDLEDALDVWIPALEHFEGGIGFDRYQNFFKELQKKGKEVWFYACFSPRGSYPNRFLDFPLLKQRYLHWINFKYNLPGFLHWGYNGAYKIWGRLYWNYRNEFCCSINRECYAPGDAFIVYPGEKRPMSCLRYEIHRRSIEDYELLRSLSNKNPRLAQEITNSVLPSITGYERRIEKFNLAWRRLASALS